MHKFLLGTALVVCVGMINTSGICQVQFSNLEVCGENCLLVEYSQAVDDSENIEGIFLDVDLVVGGQVDPVFNKFHLDLVAWTPSMTCDDVDNSVFGSYWVEEYGRYSLDLTPCAVIDHGVLRIKALLGEFSLGSNYELIQANTSKSSNNYGLSFCLGSTSLLHGDGKVETGPGISGDGFSLEHPPLSSIRMTAFPNPFNAKIGFQVEIPGGSSTSGLFKVYDIRGRKVYSRPVLAGEKGSFTWDGRNSGGTVLPSGKYFVEFKGEGQEDVVRCTVVLLK